MAISWIAQNNVSLKIHVIFHAKLAPVNYIMLARHVQRIEFWPKLTFSKRLVYVIVHQVLQIIMNLYVRNRVCSQILNQQSLLHLLDQPQYLQSYVIHLFTQTFIVFGFTNRDLSSFFHSVTLNFFKILDIQKIIPINF